MHRLFLDYNAIYISSRLGESPLVAFGERDNNITLATLAARMLWPEGELVIFEEKLAGVRRLSIATRAKIEMQKQSK